MARGRLAGAGEGTGVGLKWVGGLAVALPRPLSTSLGAPGAGGVFISPLENSGPFSIRVEAIRRGKLPSSPLRTRRGAWFLRFEPCGASSLVVASSAYGIFIEPLAGVPDPILAFGGRDFLDR